MTSRSHGARSYSWTWNYLWVLGLLVFAGCGSSNSDSTSSPKNLFSTWTENGTGFVLDLTGGNFGTQSFEYLMTGLAVCDCTIDISGTQSSGTAVMSACSYQSGTGGGSDPGCASLDASYTYTKTDTTLSVCTGGTCGAYS